MRFSIVIPTYNRAKILADSIGALFHQEFDTSAYEIIVVDDGSSDNTKPTVEALQGKCPVSLKYLHQENQGQGVARNTGVAHSSGQIILFIGDDIIATSSLLREHDKVHRAQAHQTDAVLGFVTWHPKLAVTPLMRFMEKGGAVLGRLGGHQFAYDLLEGKDLADYRFFYTANISLKKSLAAAHTFDAWFRGYGWEDIELGHRLEKKAGMKLHYAPRAIAYHDHAMDEVAFAARMRAVGRSIPAIHRKYPGLNLYPSQKKLSAFRLLASPLALTALKKVWQNLYFYGLSKKYFLEGFDAGHDKIGSWIEE